MGILKTVQSSRLGNKLLWFVRFRIAPYPRLAQDEQVMMELLPARSILDLGCARGDLLCALRAKGRTGYYEGVDFSKPAIEEARRMGDPRARFACPI